MKFILLDFVQVLIIVETRGVVVTQGVSVNSGKGKVKKNQMVLFVVFRCIFIGS